jgi:stage II sporulation protein D
MVDPMKKLISLIVPAGLLAASMGTAWADRTFRFHGGGWGHGIGMSQYGALGLANRGWGSDRILRYYYSGSSLEQRDPPASTFRIGILQGRKTTHLQATTGTFDLVLASGPVIDTVSQGGSRRIVIEGGAYRVFNGDQLVGGQPWGGTGDHLRVVRQEGGVVSVQEWGHASGRGRLEFNVAGPEKAHLIALVDPEEYLFGLGEVPSSWPDAVLQAQAVAARTYAYRKVADNPTQNRPGCNCGLYGSTLDQNYTGWDKEAGVGGSRWVAAVQATAKKVATFAGQLISTFYSSSSGGWTENVENVWGGTPQPYLRGKCDPGDYVDVNPNRIWDSALAGVEAASKLKKALGWQISAVTGFQIQSRGVSGRVVQAEIRGTNGAGAAVSFFASGESLRRSLGLKSTRFWVNRNFNVRDEIRARYDRMKCRPRLPTGPQRATKGGKWQAFEVGRLYFKAALGQAHWIHGPVLERYLKRKGPKGRLGYPVTDVKRIKKGRDRAKFERGQITCKRATGKCHTRFF